MSALLAALLLATLAQAQEAGPLTLRQALDLAKGRSLQLVAQERAADGAHELAVAAAQLPDPTLRLSIDALPINGPDRFTLTRDDFTMRTIGLTQELTRKAKRQARAASFEREAEVAQANRANDLANLQRDTAIAWLDRWYQERMRDALVAQRDEARLQIDAAEAAYRGGRGSQADVFEARSALALIEDRIDQSNRQVASAITQLARWVGTEAAQRALGERPATDTVPLSAADLATRFAHHPEIAVMTAEEKAAQAQADAALADKQADWTVGATYAKRGPAFSDYVFLSVSVPLQWDQKDRQDREVAAKLALVEQRRAEREEATREHVAQTLQQLQEWRSDRGRLERFDATLLPLAEQRTSAALAAYRGASGSLASVLAARRAEIDTRIERLDLARQTDRLWAEIEYLIPKGHDAARRP